MDRKHFSKIGAGFLLFGLLSMAVQLLISILIRMSGWDYRPYRIDLNCLITIFGMYLTAFPFTALYFSRIPKFGRVRHEQWELTAWIVVLLIGSSMCFLGNLLGNLVSHFMDAPSQNFEQLVSELYRGNLLLSFLTVVIGAPVVEELLFRKLLIDRTIGYGERISVLLSGTLFGLMHGNFRQFFYAFALGCLFAYIYCKTGKIKNTIFFHMLINFFGGFLTPLLLRAAVGFSAVGGESTAELGKQIEELVQSNPAAAMALSFLGLITFAQLLMAAAGLILFFVFKKYICFLPGIRTIPGHLEGRVVFLNPGMLAFFVFCIYEFITA